MKILIALVLLGASMSVMAGNKNSIVCAAKMYVGHTAAGSSDVYLVIDSLGVSNTGKDQKKVTVLDSSKNEISFLATTVELYMGNDSYLSVEHKGRSLFLSNENNVLKAEYSVPKKSVPNPYEKDIDILSSACKLHNQ